MKKVKRVLSMLLVCYLVVGLIPTSAMATASDTDIAYPVEGGNIYFDASTGEITDCDYDVTGANIPLQINGVAVIGIAAWAFDGMANLKSITIPEGIVSISNYAFEDCTSLKEVVLPESLEILGPSVFVGCKNLEHVVIQSNTQMSGQNFYGCEKLISAGPIGRDYCIEFSWTKSIPDNAFSGSELQSIVFPSGLEKIGDEAFYRCDSLSNVSIPDSIVEIGDDAFYGCNCAPSDIDLPEGLKTIGAYAFGGWDKVKEIIVPDSVTFIGAGAFQSCDLLEHIVIPSSVSCDGCIFSFCPKLNSAGPIGGNYNIEFGWTEEIPDYAFCGMGTVTVGKAYLESVVLPDSITRIGASAFEDCTELKSIEIPAGVTEIGDSAFRNCQSLKTIKIPSNLKTVDTFVFSDCDSLKNVFISDGVQNLEGMSFGFANFTSIFLPKSIQRIAGAFEHSDLTDVYYAGSENEWNQIEIVYGTNDSLEDATIHFNCVDENDDFSVSVRFLSGWDSTTRQVTFGSSERLSPYTYTVADDEEISNVSQLLNKYVLVTMEQGESVLEYTVTAIQPVESAIGTVTTTGEHSLTIDGTTYPVREDYIFGSYDGQELLYHVCNGTIMGFAALETKTGTLGAWDSTTGQATIDGMVYPTNYLSDLSFQNSIDQYIGQKIKYSVSGHDDYRPLIRIDELIKAETDIAVFSTEKSLTVQTGNSMWLGFGKLSDGQLVGDWSKMAVVVSDPTVISLSDYEETEYGYSIEVTGKKQGATNVTVTDTESGASTIIVITVRDSYIETYSYSISDMESFYPNNKWEDSIQTNIYDLNGMYINNYEYHKDGATSTVSFDAYNSRYHIGAVDIYDKDGNWIDSEEIAKYEMISSLWDTGEQAFYLISDPINGRLLTYEQASFSQHSKVSFEVPDGGYFTISNNYAESPGTFLFNTCEILFDGVCDLIDAGVDGVDESSFRKLIKGEVTSNKTLREAFMDAFRDTAEEEARDYAQRVLKNELSEASSDIAGQLENLLESLDIHWRDSFESATDIAEGTLTDRMGPAGLALKGCFAFSKGENKLVQAVHLAQSVDVPYANVFSSIDEGSINPHGVIVNTNGNVDAEAVLQVFRVSNNNTIEVVLDGDGDEHLKKYELYNICFVKDDQLVQPSGRVTVRIPIPDEMASDSCNVYRQEADGSWTILTAHIEGNYLVFETDHFSLYGVVGKLNKLEISSLPNKTQYKVGDIFNPDGLTLSLGGDSITKGFICDPMVLSQSGTQKITVRYGLASTEFDVSVLEADEDEGSGGGSSGGGSTGGGSTGGGGTGGGSTPVDPNTPTKPDEPAPLDFTDVVAGAWYEDAIRYVVENGLMSGYGDKKFGPNDSLTRGQFAQILYNKEGKPAITGKCGFTDVASSAWYASAVTWAANAKVVSGYGNGKYGPNDNITREQLAVMLWRYAGEPNTNGTLAGFTDANKVSDYAETALKWAVENGIVSGKGNGILDPLGNATRAEVAAMLMRYCKLNAAE